MAEQVRISLVYPGASPETLQRGIDAAWAVFKAAGVTPEDAASAFGKLECWDEAGFSTRRVPPHLRMTAADGPASAAWLDAQSAALRVCMGGQKGRPLDGWHFGFAQSGYPPDEGSAP